MCGETSSNEILRISPVSQRTQSISITFIQRWPKVFDACPTLFKYYTNALCLLGWTVIYLGITRGLPVSTQMSWKTKIKNKKLLTKHKQIKQKRKNVYSQHISYSRNKYLFTLIIDLLVSPLFHTGVYAALVSTCFPIGVILRFTKYR